VVISGIPLLGPLNTCFGALFLLVDQYWQIEAAPRSDRVVGDTMGGIGCLYTPRPENSRKQFRPGGLLPRRPTFSFGDRPLIFPGYFRAQARLFVDQMWAFVRNRSRDFYKQGGGGGGKIWGRSRGRGEGVWPGFLENFQPKRYGPRFGAGRFFVRGGQGPGAWNTVGPQPGISSWGHPPQGPHFAAGGGLRGRNGCLPGHEGCS